MGLSGLDSNKYDVLLRFKKTLEVYGSPIAPDNSLSASTSKINQHGEVEIRRLRQAQKQLSPDEINEIIAAYLSGSTTYALAKQFNCNRHTIAEHLKRRGVKVTKSKARQKLNISDVVVMYADRHTKQEIADKYSVCPHVILQCLRAEGIGIRGRWDY